MIPPRIACCARALLASAVAVLATVAAHGADGAAASGALESENKRIATERADITARFASRERECRTRFIVTSCIDDAKRERRQGLDRLRERQLGVDEARRRERTSERRAELVDKVAEDARRDAERAARFAARSASGVASQGGRARPVEARPERAEAAASGASAAAHRPRTPSKTPVIKPRPRESTTVRQEREARSRAAFETKQRQAAGHREESATEAIRRMAAKSPAAPLPAPSGASAAKPR